MNKAGWFFVGVVVSFLLTVWVFTSSQKTMENWITEVYQIVESTGRQKNVSYYNTKTGMMIKQEMRDTTIVNLGDSVTVVIVDRFSVWQDQTKQLFDGQR